MARFGRWVELVGVAELVGLAFPDDMKVIQRAGHIGPEGDRVDDAFRGRSLTIQNPAP